MCIRDSPRIMAPPPDHYVHDGMNGGASPGEERGRMTYSFQKSGAGELSVDEGKEVTIVEQDGT